MKNLLLGSALALSTLAVMMPVQNVMAQDASVATVGSVGKGINWLAKRIYTIDIGTHAYEMEQDGVMNREYVAVFNVSGAMVHNYELAGSKEGIDKVGREPGMQILPYTVSITNDGRKLISVGAFSMKSMNKAYRNIKSTDNNYYNGRHNYQDAAWSILNRLDALVYEYDDSMGMANTKVERLDLIRAEAKVDILGASTPGHFLAVVGRGSIGFEKHTIITNNDILTISDVDSDEDQTKAFNAKYGIGLEYNLPIGKTGNFNTEVMLNGARIGGQNYSQADQNSIKNTNTAGQQNADSINETNNVAYSQSLDQYENDKASYEAQSLEGVSISDESYYSLTGVALPLSPERVKYKNIEYNAPKSARTYMYLSPRMSYSGKMGGNTRFQLNVFGNIPLRDDVKTNGIKLDLSGTNAKPLFGAGIKVQF
jgi:hypothetical protein